MHPSLFCSSPAPPVPHKARTRFILHETDLFCTKQVWFVLNTRNQRAAQIQITKLSLGCLGNADPCPNRPRPKALSTGCRFGPDSHSLSLREWGSGFSLCLRIRARLTLSLPDPSCLTDRLLIPHPPALALGLFPHLFFHPPPLVSATRTRLHPSVQGLVGFRFQGSGLGVPLPSSAPRHLSGPAHP